MNIPKLTLSEEQIEAIVREELAMREELRAGEIKYPAGQAPRSAGADEYKGLETGAASGLGLKNIVRVPVKPGMGKPEQAAAKAAAIKASLEAAAVPGPRAPVPPTAKSPVEDPVALGRAIMGPQTDEDRLARAFGTGARQQTLGMPRPTLEEQIEAIVREELAALIQ